MNLSHQFFADFPWGSYTQAKDDSSQRGFATAFGDLLDLTIDTKVRELQVFGLICDDYMLSVGFFKDSQLAPGEWSIPKELNIDLTQAPVLIAESIVDMRPVYYRSREFGLDIIGENSERIHDIGITAYNIGYEVVTRIDGMFESKRFTISIPVNGSPKS